MTEKVGLSTVGALEEMRLKTLSIIRKKKIVERLQQRLDYENSSQFYHCGNNDCNRMTFEEALEEFFKCSSCGQALNLKKNEKLQNAFTKQIDKIRKDVQN